MTEIVLDIGAGGTLFAKRFRKFNKKADLMYLCGEPSYRNPCRFRSRLAKPKRKKILKVKARYDHFGLPDASLMMVSLNAYKLSLPREAFQEELIRCLKPGGMFFSAHPIGQHPELSLQHFAPIEFGWDETFTTSGEGAVYFQLDKTFPSGAVHVRFMEQTVSGSEPSQLAELHYPASRTIEHRLKHGKSTTSDDYLYAGMDEMPTLKIWMRTEY